jgi:hypothetical protein
MRLLIGLLAAVWLFAAAPTAAMAQSFPYCAPGEAPRFQLGFAALQARLGATMGQPIECEHTDPASGDAVQRTTTGLAFYRKSTNTPTFTDGWRHWALTPSGLVYWEGTAIDPPGVTVAAAPPEPPRQRTLQSFVQGVGRQVDDYWRERFAREGRAYSSPRNVLWMTDGTIRTACGWGRPGGPGYCPADRSLFFPARFFERFWPEPDAAIVVVIAHEWAHHAQLLRGMLRGQYLTIQTELQADCFSGNFFAHARERNWLDPGDVEEAAQMSFNSGDDADWRDPRAHGSPQQRLDAFMAGYGGNPCWGMTR